MAGPAAEVERAKPILEAISRKLFVLGTEPASANMTIREIRHGFLVITQK
jgi:3-hydroxyisobutyrate dehydrogenase-like beta-hydroxyacid dehydrogenase